MIPDNRTQVGAPAVIDASMGGAPAAAQPVVQDTIINAVYNRDKGFGAPDTGALYRIRHTAENARAAVKAAARAYMEARGGIHPETSGRGPWQASFTWGDAVTLLPEEPELLARHGILDIAVLDIVPDVVVNHDEDLLPGTRIRCGVRSRRRGLCHNDGVDMAQAMLSWLCPLDKGGERCDSNA